MHSKRNNHYRARPGLLCALILAGAAMSAAADGLPTQTDAKPGAKSLDVHGPDGKFRQFGGADLARLKQYTVQANAHGQSFNCVGERLIDIVASVGAAQGEALRGAPLASYIRVTAADGYRAVFSLAELDPGMRDAVPIITSSCNGTVLDEKDGPLRIIVPRENRPARWVRQVTSIDLLSAP